MSRAGTAVSRICVNDEVPPLMLTEVLPEGRRKTGWLKRLKTSILNWKCSRSRIVNLLISEKSQFCWYGPRKALRGVVPHPVAPGLVAKPVAGIIGAVPKQAGFK